MSIIESLKTWLSGYDGLISDAECNRMAADAEAIGLFKAPENIVTPFIDGTQDVTAYYTLGIRRGSQTDSLRKTNEEWLEGLDRWVRRKNLQRLLPILDGDRTCYAVSVSGTYLMDAQTDADTVWSVTLAVSYQDDISTETEESDDE